MSNERQKSLERIEARRARQGRSSVRGESRSKKKITWRRIWDSISFLLVVAVVCTLLWAVVMFLKGCGETAAEIFIDSPTKFEGAIGDLLTSLPHSKEEATNHELWHDVWMDSAGVVRSGNPVRQDIFTSIQYGSDSLAWAGFQRELKRVSPESQTRHTNPRDVEYRYLQVARALYRKRILEKEGVSAGDRMERVLYSKQCRIHGIACGYYNLPCSAWNETVVLGPFETSEPVAMTGRECWGFDHNAIPGDSVYWMKTFPAKKRILHGKGVPEKVHPTPIRYMTFEALDDSVTIEVTFHKSEQSEQHKH